MTEAANFSYNLGPLGRRCLYAQLNHPNFPDEHHESAGVYLMGLQENGLWDIGPAAVAAQFSGAKLYDGNKDPITFTEYAVTPNKGVILTYGPRFKWIAEK
jgi:hypothetical protein